MGKSEMPFAIVADLPLGTYHGAGPDGQPEPVPSVARLHAALLCAAGFGPRAVSTGPDSLDVREEDQAALRWLEENPPDSVAIPALQINIAYPVAYRDDGTIKRSKASASVKKLAKSPGGGTAVADEFAWIWTEAPPPDIRGSLAELCPDVAYLGTTEAPARLRAVTGEKIEATADLDATAGMFSTAVTALARPARGRTAELMAAHQDVSGRPPSAAADKIKANEKSLSPVPRRSALATARYRDRARPAVQAPWQRVIVLPLDRVIGEEYRVSWAVAAHRALVRLIGYGAPPLVTGAYPPGTARPANRLALHVLGPETPATPVRLRDQAGRPRSALLLLVPDGADAGDLDALDRGVAACHQFAARAAAPPGSTRLLRGSFPAGSSGSRRPRAGSGYGRPGPPPSRTRAATRAGHSPTPPCCRWRSPGRTPGRTGCPGRAAGAASTTRTSRTRSAPSGRT